jgi:uncharacterized protein (DUF2267 family)
MNRTELVQTVAQRAGISAAQAEKAVEAVVGQLKTRLPAPLGNQLDNILEGKGGEGGAPDIGDAAQGVGKMFGR